MSSIRRDNPDDNRNIDDGFPRLPEGAPSSRNGQEPTWTLAGSLSLPLAATAMANKTLMDVQEGEGESEDEPLAWADRSFDEWASELALPDDDRCYLVGVTLACNRHIYRKTRLIDNTYAEYVVPCGSKGRIKPGNAKSQEEARKHARSCDHFRARAMRVYPHPDANVEHGEKSYCKRCRMWKDAAWDKSELLSPRLTWRSKTDKERDLIATTTVKGEDTTKGKIRLYREKP